LKSNDLGGNLAVKIKLQREIRGKMVDHYEYYSEKMVTKSDLKKADEIDSLLKQKCDDIVKKFKHKKIIKTGKHKGNLETWYKLGKELSFIDELDVREQDRRWIYRAIYNHIDWINVDKAAIKHPEHSHYSKCHQISKFPWEKVKAIGNWSQWYPLLENAMFANNDGERLMNWLYDRILEDDERIKGWPTKKSRIFNKHLTPRINQKISTKQISDDELSNILENVANKAHSEYQK